MKYNFTGYRILRWWSSFNMWVFHSTLILFSWCLIRNLLYFSLLSPIGKVAPLTPWLFSRFFLYLWFSSVWIWYCLIYTFFGIYLSSLVFSKPPGLVVWCLHLIGGNFHHYFFFLLYLLPSLLVFQLHRCYILWNCSTVVGCSGFFFSFILFSLYISVWDNSTDISSSSLIPSSLVSHLLSLSKVFFISIYNVFDF